MEIYDRPSREVTGRRDTENERVIMESKKKVLTINYKKTQCIVVSKTTHQCLRFNTKGHPVQVSSKIDG